MRKSAHCPLRLSSDFSAGAGCSGRVVVVARLVGSVPAIYGKLLTELYRGFAIMDTARIEQIAVEVLVTQYYNSDLGFCVGDIAAFGFATVISACSLTCQAVAALPRTFILM